MGFSSWNAYRRFAHEVRSRNRYILSDESKAFLEEVGRGAKEHEHLLTEGSVLLRAQLGQTDQEYDHEVYGKVKEHFAHPESRMFPEKVRASEGRVNPKGIPCFYAATDKTTAVSEVRPLVGAKVSVGCFRTLRDLNIVDCCNVPDHLPFYINISETGQFKEPDQPKIDEMVWGWINHAFSKPTDNDHGVADYAPTQMIAEIWKQAGYDGIGYKSKLGPGLNIALFDLDAVEIKFCEIHEVKSVAITHDECGNGWSKKGDAGLNEMTYFYIANLGPAKNPPETD